MEGIQSKIGTDCARFTSVAIVQECTLQLDTV